MYLYQMTVSYQKIKYTLRKYKYISSFNIEDEDIYRVINILDINKVYGHNEVFVRMLKLCGKSIVKPLFIIFKICKLKKTFPNLWKKANVVSIYKKKKKIS